jgi:hypothetical protein
VALTAVRADGDALDFVAAPLVVDRELLLEVERHRGGARFLRLAEGTERGGFRSRRDDGGRGRATPSRRLRRRESLRASPQQGKKQEERKSCDLQR